MHGEAFLKYVYAGLALIAVLLIAYSGCDDGLVAACAVGAGHQTGVGCNTLREGVDGLRFRPFEQA